MKNSSIILLFNISLKYMGRFFRPLFWLLLIVIFSTCLFLFNNQKVEAIGYGPGDVLINEFTVGGTQWVELLNTTESDIDFDSGDWNFIVTAMGPGGSTGTLMGIIPQKGILTSVFSLPTTTAMLSVSYLGTDIYTVSYGAGFNMGEPHIADVPEDGESAALQQDTSWSIDTTPSKGWFNNAIDYDCPATSSTTPPTLSSIASCLLSESSVDTNMDDLSDPSSAGGLYFEKISKGKITFNSLLNLTDGNVVQALQSLGEKLELAAGSLKFDSTLAQDMSSATATLIMYGMDDYGYTSEPKLIIRDDSGVEISTSSPEYPSLNNLTFNTSTGDFTFTTNHFTQYDGSPVLLEVTPVPVTTTDQTPDYTFSSNVAGSVYFGGDCGMTPSTTMISGNNTITFATLAIGEHSNCYLIGIDGVGNSSTLNISAFTIEEGTQPPVAPTINKINGSASITQYSDNLNLEIDIGISSTSDYIEVYGSSTLLLTFIPTTSPSIVTTSLSSEGSWNIYAKAIKNGLTSTDSNVYVYNYDITKPQVLSAVSSPDPFTSADTTTTITVVFNEPVDTSVDPNVSIQNDIVINKISFTSTTWIGTASLSGVTFDGTSPIAVTGTVDLAGNTMNDNSSAGTFVLNTIPPTIFINDDVSATAVTSDSVRFWIMDGDVDTTTLYYGFKTDNSCDASVSYIYPYGNDIAFTITSSVNNGKYICAKAEDIYGNNRYQASTNPLNIDTSGPTVTKLGDGTVDYDISAGSDDYLVFNKELSVSSKTTVENVLNAGASDTLNYSWTSATLTISNPHASAVVFANDVFATVADLAGNTSTNLLLVDSKLNYIQDQIDAASPGSVINIPAGTYNECLSINKALTLAGSSGEGTIIDMNDCSSRWGVRIDASNVTVKDLTIQNSGSFDDSRNAIEVHTEGSITNLVLDNLTMTDGKAGQGIYILNTNGIIKNSNIQNFCRGIYLGNLDGFTIENNIISNNGVTSSCVLPTTGIHVQDEADNIAIKNNTISDNDVGVHLSTIIPDFTNIILEKNKITGNNGLAPFVSPFGVKNDNSVNLVASMNWWGDESGPEYSGNASGTGDIISDYVDYVPWYADENMTILQGTPTTSGDYKVYTLTSDYSATSSGYVLTIPSSTVVTGTLAWDGSINPPATTSTPSNLPTQSGYTTTAGVTIEVGFSEGKLILSNAAKLVFPNQKDKRIGYTRPGEGFTEITAVCGANTQVWADANLGAEGDCKINDGNDLVVWTKHFTKFSTYSLTAISNGGGGGTPISRPVLGNIPVTVAGGNTVTSRDISLSFDVTGVSMMAISENSNYAGASWEMYASPKTFTLSEGYGDKTLHIKFRSGSGGETATSIMINYITPTTEVTTVITEAPTIQTTVADTSGFTFNFRTGLTEKQKQSIMNLVNSGRLFSQTDARNYAWAIGASDWQQFVGKNPKTNVTTGETVSRYVFTKYLGVGSVGKDVQALQQILKELGYFNFPYVTGYYGSITREAVIKYQKAKGLVPYPGHVGPATRAALNAE